MSSKAEHTDQLLAFFHSHHQKKELWIFFYPKKLSTKKLTRSNMK